MMFNNIAVAQAALQEQFRTSLYHTAKYLCGYDLVNWRTHGAMIEALEAPTTRKLIVMPRGTFKTSIAVVAYPIWLMLRNPNIRIMLDSELWSLSSASLREIKSQLKSERFREVFPDWATSNENQDQIIINKRTRPKKEATITASGIGAGKTGQHYDVIIADDMSSPRNTNTPELAEKTITHYRYYTSILDPGGTLVVIGTRYSELDLIGWILKNEIEHERTLSSEAGTY